MKKILFIALLMCGVYAFGQETTGNLFQPTYKYVNKKIYYGYLIASYNPTVWSSNAIEINGDSKNTLEYEGIFNGYTNFKIELNQGLFTSPDLDKFKSFELSVWYDYKNLRFDKGSHLNKFNDVGFEVGYGGILKVFLGLGFFNEGMTFDNDTISTAKIKASPYYSVKIFMGAIDKSHSKNADRRRTAICMYGRLKYSGSAKSDDFNLTGQKGTFFGANAGIILRNLSKPKNRVGFAYSFGAAMDYYYLGFEDRFKQHVFDVTLIGGIGLSW